MRMTTLWIANRDNDRWHYVIELETFDSGDVVVFPLEDKRMLEPITLENLLGRVPVLNATRRRLKRHVPDFLVGKPEIFETFRREIVYAPKVQFCRADIEIH
jgi:hypothetical protein